MGPGCLTAVFGMGTGGAIQVWSPRKIVGERGRVSALRERRLGALTRPRSPNINYGSGGGCNLVMAGEGREEDQCGEAFGC
jgi:hypothetical protein